MKAWIEMKFKKWITAYFAFGFITDFIVSPCIVNITSNFLNFIHPMVFFSKYVPAKNKHISRNANKPWWVTALWINNKKCCSLFILLLFQQEINVFQKLYSKIHCFSFDSANPPVQQITFIGLLGDYFRFVIVQNFFTTSDEAHYLVMSN